MNRLGWVIAALALGIVLLLGAHIYTMSRLHEVEESLAALKAAQAEQVGSVQQEVVKLKEAESAAGIERQKTLEALQQEVEYARRLANGAAGKVKEEAQKSLAELADRLNENERRIQESQSRVANELSGVRQANTSAQSNINAVSTKVAAVESTVNATRTQLDAATADLQRVRGDLGQMSGLIATNAQQIEALRQLGDRNYVEFTLFKSKDPVQVGGISIVLKKADEKNHRYSIDLLVDDRKVEKKDRTVNEPLQFFMGRDKQAHELVVNRVGKDQIAGYLASPKNVAR